MKMNKLMKKLIRLDSEYFEKMGYQTAEDRQAVTDWLDGTGNPTNVQPAYFAARWLNLDADYFEQCQGVVIRQFWYLTPFILVGFWVIKRLYRRTAERIKGDSSNASSV